MNDPEVQGFLVGVVVFFAAVFILISIVGRFYPITRSDVQRHLKKLKRQRDIETTRLEAMEVFVRTEAIQDSSNMHPSRYYRDKWIEQQVLLETLKQNITAMEARL